VNDLDEMEDPCMGDMQWMLGWCMGTEPPDVAALAALAESSSAGEFTSIDVPGAAATRAFGINPRGEIVGSYTDRAVPPVTHGYLLRNGVFTTVDYPGAAATEAWGINPLGDIIGRYTRAGVPGIRGFLLRHGGYTDISIGNHLITLPTKIGASGHVVGCYHDANTLVDMYGYVQRGSSVTSFALPSTIGPAAAMHNGVTRGGRLIVGLTNPAPDRTRGYALSQDMLTYIDFPGSNFTQAWDVNASGTIVGVYRDAARRFHGFYRVAGDEAEEDDEGELEEDEGNAVRFVAIDYPGSVETRAFGINPRGDIVGMYGDALGAHGFLLTRAEEEEDDDD
jgi:uncharacterized membrane protein